ncbi:hypothetical protein [Marinilabilia sp.]|nr:hypothetical protein [Marinilabilia sp.]
MSYEAENALGVNPGNPIQPTSQKFIFMSMKTARFIHFEEITKEQRETEG